MSSESNKQVVENAWTAMNRGDLDALDNCFDEDVRYRDTEGEEYLGLDAYKELTAPVLSAMPDFSIESHEIIGEGDTVMGHYTASGTQEDGTVFEKLGVSVFRFKNGKIIEELNF